MNTVDKFELGHMYIPSEKQFYRCPDNIKVKRDDICNSKEQYLCHQVNSITTHAKHIALTIFQRFPYANIYAIRQQPDEMGVVIGRGDEKHRYVLNIVAQRYPGNSRYIDDTKEMRQAWFKQCLSSILAQCKDISTPISFAFPWRIGCGAAGGDWDEYLSMLVYFAAALPQHQIVLYTLETK